MNNDQSRPEKLGSLMSRIELIESGAGVLDGMYRLF
jgi:hypothetical protein